MGEQGKEAVREGGTDGRVEREEREEGGGKGREKGGKGRNIPN